MKKILFCGFFLTAAFYFSMGQYPNFGISGGESISNYTWKFGGRSFHPAERVGITAGFLIDLPAKNSRLSYQPAVNFVQKGCELEIFGEKNKIQINCIEVMPNFVYYTEDRPESFYFGGGPAIGLNISGKSRYTDETDYDNLSFGNKEEHDDMKRFDLGLNLMCGYRFPNGFFVSGGYNKGLNNLFPNGNSYNKMNSSYFSFKLGMLLAGKK